MNAYLKKYSQGIYGRVKKGLIHLGYYSKPAFLIIGGQKCGTSALFKYLSDHPNIETPRRKEIGYFDQDEKYRRGHVWYHSHFPMPKIATNGRAVTYEATPEYLYNPLSAERILAYDPQIKLIVLVRDPVQRAYSAWQMYRRKLSYPRYQPIMGPYMKTLGDFDLAVRSEVDGIGQGGLQIEPSYVRRGLYLEQLLRYLKYFPRSQMLVLNSGALLDHTGKTLNAVVSFLGLQEVEWKSTKLERIGVGGYEEGMSQKTRLFLRGFYEPFNKKLYEFLGQEFCW